ncbi:hypothetical protein AAFF_G00033170 [Aldrovandia affinis]|uniref:Uncharacterized protein n=1 Tax=Aldrovandia affinis TaxID=143900 RepID=A0AAD7S3Y2_9TELE|nr:hypothetical protein AAFF_G00033170 [Aldrovandia affinis]
MSSILPQANIDLLITEIEKVPLKAALKRILKTREEINGHGRSTELSAGQMRMLQRERTRITNDELSRDFPSRFLSSAAHQRDARYGHS